MSEIGLNAIGKYIVIKIKKVEPAQIQQVTSGGIAIPSVVTEKEDYKIPNQLDARNIAEVVSIGPDVKPQLTVGQKVYVAGGCPLVMEKDNYRIHFCYIDNIVGLVE